ncbi:uncharacterized protein A1O5_06560 [Cladophialophora psammophila CBS 110553]|uniref:Amine oxidase n=1 Tax=Cladophialophora psammophila CBS 110553 TaxID=1182543 RepID=W9X0P2_9EURO|nr:uncharacterized protein A1O5_06560 [Cladophialophora psammophila CBS 110553]EXJ70491.1 hypothetical protein A1O5_06560 [Cladophialophora psammophila CBS 110553]
MLSREGYHWNATEGLVKGLPCIGKIEPASNLQGENRSGYDVVVLGAGYAGLTAARDLTLAGYRTLILEARDRIGGRSWSSNIGSYPYEMGGTWVSWRQPHVWREISRYEMRDQLEVSPNQSTGKNFSTLTTKYGQRDMAHHEEDALIQSALRKLANVDDAEGKNAMPFPHNEGFVPETSKLDSLSLSDRLKQIEHSLSPDELAIAKEWVLATSGGTPENTSFYEFLHWWALSGHSYQGWVEDMIKYKFRGGQSSFAIRFFQEALATGKLAYAFDNRVTSVVDSGKDITIQTASGQTFRGAKVVCTIPLNVLHTISFSPPLSPAKAQAIKIGHVNKMSKVHCESRGLDLRSWSGLNSSCNPLTFAFGDGITPDNNTHIVAFGPSEKQLHPERDVEATKRALQNLTSMDIKRLVFHNWAEDEFAQGAWFFSGPGFITKYLQDLRGSHGNIYFANSDWAVGWRSFIDGAIEEGTRAALNIQRSLRQKTI